MLQSSQRKSRLSASSFPERRGKRVLPLRRGRRFYFLSRAWTLLYVGQSRGDLPPARECDPIGLAAIGSVRTRLSRLSDTSRERTIRPGKVKNERGMWEGSRITKSASMDGASRRGGNEVSIFIWTVNSDSSFVHSSLTRGYSATECERTLLDIWAK